MLTHAQLTNLRELLAKANPLPWTNGGAPSSVVVDEAARRLTDAIGYVSRNGGLACETSKVRRCEQCAHCRVMFRAAALLTTIAQSTAPTTGKEMDELRRQLSDEATCCEQWHQLALDASKRADDLRRLHDVVGYRPSEVEILALLRKTEQDRDSALARAREATDLLRKAARAWHNEAAQNDGIIGEGCNLAERIDAFLDPTKPKDA